MPKKKNDSYSSRSERRKNKGFDRFLNWAIGIVVVLIVLIGGYLLFNVLHSPNNEASTTNAHETKQNDTKDKAKSDSEAKGTEGKKENVVPNDATQNSDSGTSSATSDDENSDDSVSGGGPKGPWNPVGTTQSEPHQTNYDEGSVDWNERLKALSYATGISEDNMTLIWLGNGGAPDKSLGKVKEKGTSKVYDVLLKWVTDKGWQPVSVDAE